MRTFRMPSSASPSATNFSDKFYWPSNKDLYFFFFCVKVEAKKVSKLFLGKKIVQDNVRVFSFF